MTYSELKEIFQELKRTSPKEDLTAHIIFTEDSFDNPYSLLSRTYSVSSDNNGFWPGLISRSIFAYCLDVTSDQGVRLDWYMAEEGNPGGWKVEECYVLEQMRDAEAMSDLTRIELELSSCYQFLQRRGLAKRQYIVFDPTNGGVHYDVYALCVLMFPFTTRATATLTLTFCLQPAPWTVLAGGWASSTGITFSTQMSKEFLIRSRDGTNLAEV